MVGKKKSKKKKTRPRGNSWGSKKAFFIVGEEQTTGKSRRVQRKGAKKKARAEKKGGGSMRGLTAHEGSGSSGKVTNVDPGSGVKKRNDGREKVKVWMNNTHIRKKKGRFGDGYTCGEKEEKKQSDPRNAANESQHKVGKNFLVAY